MEHAISTDDISSQTISQDFFNEVRESEKRVKQLSAADLDKVKFHCVDICEPDDLQFDCEAYQGIANFQRVNDIPHINRLFNRTNELLPSGNFFVICLETIAQRKERILNKFPKGIGHLYYTLDFVLKRVFPKWGATRKIYHWLTGGRNRVMSISEGLGRLVASGFSIIDFQKVRYLTYVIAQKTEEPVEDDSPTMGVFCRFTRVGKGGELITVYKLRTMHPYSEYLQEYVFDTHYIQNNGKLRKDYRITSWGRFFRKYWIDELPMLYNWLKGDLKLVGVRPLTRHYFELFPPDVQKLRMRVKPGLVPPFYAELPETFEEIVEAERTYLRAYFAKPIHTDVRYFFKAVFNMALC